MERKDAINLLKKYNKEEFHIRHALTVESVMIALIHPHTKKDQFNQKKYMKM